MVVKAGWEQPKSEMKEKVPEALAREIERVKIAEAEVRGKTWATFLADHKKIVDFLDSCAKSGRCSSVTSIADKTRIKEEDTRAHLELMETSRGGAYIDKEENTFCNMPGILAIASIMEGIAKRALAGR